MPLLDRRRPDSLQDLIRQIQWYQSEKVQSEAFRRLQLYTPREVYNDDDFISCMNKQVVDNLVMFTMRRCSCTHPIREDATNLLVDGYAVFRLREQDTGPEEDVIFVPGEYVAENPDHILKTQFKHGELVAVEIQYDYYPEAIPFGPIDYEPRRNKLADAEAWTYWARYDRTAEGANYFEMKWPEADPNSSRATRKSEKLPVFPYKGVQWHTHESLIEPVKSTIFRYEAAFRNIAGENDRHARRTAVYRGVDNFSKTAEELKDNGRESIPKDAEKYYPDTHPDGIEPMFRELDRLEDEIRHTVGIVRLMKLHNTSGPSRDLEIAPLLSQANALRQKCDEIMSIAYPTGHLHWGPLTDMSPQDIQLAVQTLRDNLWEGALTDQEYGARIRLLHDFPNVPPPQDRTAQQLAISPLPPSTMKGQGRAVA